MRKEAAQRGVSGSGLFGELCQDVAWSKKYLRQGTGREVVEGGGAETHSREVVEGSGVETSGREVVEGGGV